MIHVKKNGSATEYFKQKEADAEGIQYVPWRDAKESGQWVLTDDAYVLQTIEVRYITEKLDRKTPFRIRRKIKTGLGIRFPHGRQEFNLKENIEKKSFGYYPQYWWEDFDTRFPAVKSMVAKLVLTGKLKLSESRRYDRYDYAAMILVADKLLKDAGLTWYHVRTFIGRDETRNMIRAEIAKIAKQRGINVDKVFDLLQEAESIGRTKNDGKVILAVAKEYAGIVGMNLQLHKGDRAFYGDNGQLLPHTDEELPGSESTFDRIIEQEKVEEPTSSI